MKESRDSLKKLLDRYGSPLYVFDESGFTNNYHELYSSMSSLYGKYRIAYSFKTNYTPYICKVVNKLGGYAEVVSGMEYELAKKLGYKDQEIIFNGPDKGSEGVRAFLSGSMVNVDSLDELKIYCKEAESNPSGQFKIGLRVNLDIGQNFVSRFGMDEEDLKEAFKIVSLIKNLHIAGLHCHISRCRGINEWKKRTEYMLQLADRFFEHTPDYVDLGSGMFGSMSPELASQFDCIPTYSEYADVTAGLFAEHYKNMEGPILFTEPGTTLINRFVECVAKVKYIKKIKNRYFAVLDVGEHILGETCTLKRLPVRVIPGGVQQNCYENIDLTGYTCLEQDVVLSSYEGRLAKGDYIIFENTGGYSNVLKPPFIRPGCAMIARTEDGKYLLIKEAETFHDVFRSYVF